MIDQALIFLRDQVDAYLRVELGEPATRAVSLSPIVRQDGELAIDGRVGMALVAVEEERVTKRQHRPVVDGESRLAAPEIRLNLHILFAARATDGGTQYEEALRSLSGVATFFQAHRSFESSEYPALPAEIETLVVELETLDYENQNNVWGTLGAKLLPSLMYRVRLVRIQAGAVAEVVEPITEIRTSTTSHQ